MKKFTKFSLFTLTAALAFTVCLPVFARKTAPIEADAAAYLGKATGYTEADDVDYVYSGGYVANWGARDEDCVFLSEYAEGFYTGSYTYEVLSKTKGGTSGSNASSSGLYSSLKTLMSSKQTYQTSYDATKSLFKYTDCVNSNYSYISSFYSGVQMSGNWGNGWNREHTWPNSKGDKSGNGENDIMMLRPTSTSENSSRGNKAYGQISGYYDPNELEQNLRGDCARIVLFVYTRWGCTDTGSEYNPNGIYGTDGVIQSLDVLLDWMEEDPVDTWEMGRNDAVQSITGTRNVFVDYPEYAFQLFGRAVPSDMVTPSKASRGESVTPPTSEKPEPPTSEQPPVSEESETPEHTFIDWVQTKAPTATEPGEEYRICTVCYKTETREIPALGGVTPPTSEANGESGSGCGGTIIAPMFVTLLVAVAGVILKKKEQ